MRTRKMEVRFLIRPTEEQIEEISKLIGKKPIMVKDRSLFFEVNLDELHRIFKTLRGKDVKIRVFYSEIHPVSEDVGCLIKELEK